jgi:hypothetical protein
MEAPRRYGLLQAIAIVLKAVGWVILFLGIIVGIWLLLIGGSLGRWGGFGVMLIGLLKFLVLYALGSILSVLVDIEQQSRALALRSQG